MSIALWTAEQKQTVADMYDRGEPLATIGLVFNKPVGAISALLYRMGKGGDRCVRGSKRDARLERVRAMLTEGKTGQEITRELGMNRNSITRYRNELDMNDPKFDTEVALSLKMGWPAIGRQDRGILEALKEPVGSWYELYKRINNGNVYTRCHRLVKAGYVIRRQGPIEGWRIAPLVWWGRWGWTEEHKKQLEIVYDWLPWFVRRAMNKYQWKDGQELHGVATEYIVQNARLWDDDRGIKLISYVTPWLPTHLRWYIKGQRKRQVKTCQLTEYEPEGSDTLDFGNLLEWEPMLKDLPERWEWCVRRIYFDGWTYPEAAKVLNISKTRIRQMIDKALSRLRTCIVKSYPNDELAGLIPPK